MLGFEMTKFSKWLHPNSKHWSLLGLTVIRNYTKEGAIFVRKCHTVKNCNYSWTELNNNIGEIGPESPVPARGVWAIRPGLVFFWFKSQVFGPVTKKSLCFFLFCSVFIPSAFWYFWFWIHTASAPSTAGTSTGGGAVIRKPGSASLEGTPTMDLGHMNVVLKWMYCWEWIEELEWLLLLRVFLSFFLSFLGFKDPT